MIICASRRTDIPAFHSEWFMGRLRSGHVMVRNPVQKDVVYDISLKRKDVDCIVFISKNPQPLEKYLPEISDMGHRMMFQITVNPYGRRTEPNVPDVDTMIDSFIRISSFIGKDHMVWRYDPVIFSEEFDIQYHISNFEMICRRLSGYTDRCVFSFLSMYDKISENYRNGSLRSVSDIEKVSFCREISRIAKRYGIELDSCCISDDLSQYGVRRRACLDPEELKLLGIPFERQTAPMRENCICARSIDIGAYDTCMHNCIYCYANGPDANSRRNIIYDKDNEMIVGSISDDDRIVRIGRRVNARITDY